MIETWRSINDYEGKYQVSNFGNVRSLDRYIEGKDGKTKKFPGKILSLVKQNAGYVTVGLSKDSVVTSFLVHRLVAAAFIDNPENLPEVNHKDGVKHNNNLSNLEWMSRVRNIRHAMGMGLIQGLGEQNPSAKLSEVDVIEIKKLLRLNLSKKEIAKVFGVKSATISDIDMKRSWVHVTAPAEWSEIRKGRGGEVSRITYEIYDKKHSVEKSADFRNTAD